MNNSNFYRILFFKEALPGSGPPVIDTPQRYTSYDELRERNRREYMEKCVSLLYFLYYLLIPCVAPVSLLLFFPCRHLYISWKLRILRVNVIVQIDSKHIAKCKSYYDIQHPNSEL